MSQSLTPDSRTPRHGLPRLFVAQAQKELFVNEALEAIDWLLSPAIEGIAASPAGLTPEPGQGWLISANPGGAWAGKAGNFAVWSEGGWRFYSPHEGQTATIRSSGAMVRYVSDQWLAAPIIAAPSGGQVQDDESRNTIVSIIAAMRQFGMII